MASLTYTQLLLGNRSFRRLWVGQVVSELGNWFNFIAGLGLVRAVSSAAPEVTAVMLVARLAPFALLAPLAGAAVDRWSRRTVMIASDLARSLFALGFLFVRGPEDLWIAYACTVVSTLLAAFFEAAKNAAVPNITGDNGLLAGNALMFSSRFLLMSLGAALGGAASAHFGYEVAFVINALSFIVSAFSIWLIPESQTRQKEDPGVCGSDATQAENRVSFWTDIKRGWKYIVHHRLITAIIGLNILWAVGGGAVNLVYDRLGGVVFAARNAINSDANVATLYAMVGAGLFVGMLFARRVGAHVELRKATAGFIGWTMIAHGILFALAGLMPTLGLAGLMFFLSRVVIGVEFAVQDTLLLRLLPDNLRGRVSITDRAAEISVMSVSTVIAGWSLHVITPRGLTIISGLLTACPGVVWLALFASGRLRLPAGSKDAQASEKVDESLFASAG